MEWNIADLFEAAVDSVPDRDFLVADRRAGRTRSSRSAPTGSRTISRRRASGPATTSASTRSTAAEFVETMFACYKLRAVPINVNYRYVEAELRVPLRQRRPRRARSTSGSSRRASRRSAARCRSCATSSSIDDGSGEDTATLGSVAYEDALAGAERRARLRAALAPTTSTSSTPAARRACRRASCGGSEDVIFVLGGGIDHVTGIRVTRPSGVRAKAQRTRR